MKISRNWLSNYIDLADKSDSELEKALTVIGFEVEGVETTGLVFTDNIVVGEVQTSGQHPNADRLSVNEVDVGDGMLRHIVCGAKNFKVGDRVFVALPGAKVLGPDGDAFKIKKSKLRGEPSEGMMCSARELGLGDDHSGLWILEDRPDIGTPIEDIVMDRDTIFDIEVTPNRPDCLNHIGIARELSALYGRNLIYPEVKASSNDPSFGDGLHSLLKSIRVEAEEQCPQYFGYSIRGVKIAPSPDWLQQAIQAVGLRPVNNVVDVTNFVMLETGQPLHAFDPEKIGGKELIIRQARPGETITTLDGRKRELDATNTVIADTESALVVAGVMGSLDAEVDDNTTDILLEAAYFRPSFIRRTSRRLGLSTDSSYRFERGVDPSNVEYAALRAIDLILEVAGGSVMGRPIIVGHPPISDSEILLRPQQIRDLLGFGPDDREIESVLSSLELEVAVVDETPDQESWRVRIPSFRRDLERPVDLAEEFLRIYGTDNIPEIDVQTRAHTHRVDPVNEFNTEAADLLIGQRFVETMSYSLRSEAEVKHWYGHAVEEALSLANPLTADQSHLRPSLLLGLLDVLKLNLARNSGMTRLFERGRVFREYGGKVYELASIGFLLYVDPDTPGWKTREPADFYTCKTLVEGLLNLARVPADVRQYRPLEDAASWQPGQSAKVGEFQKDGFECKLGLMNSARVREWDIKGLVFAGGLIVNPDFLKTVERDIQYIPVSAFPPVTKDLALVVDQTVLAETVRSLLVDAAEQATKGAFEVESVSIFDVYEGMGIPDGKKSLAFSMVFRSNTRTLNDKEVNQAFNEIQKTMTAETGFSVRS